MVCEASSTNEEKGTWNLSSVVELIRTDVIPTSVNLEMHVFWRFSPEEFQQNFEGRLVIAVGLQRLEYSDAFVLTSSVPYLHLLLRGMPIFAPDEHRLGVEWRRQEQNNQSEWKRELVFWPFTVQQSS